MSDRTSRRQPVLIVFARAPRLGAVKRRLAAGIGDPAALNFYLRTTQTILHRVSRDARWRTVLAMTPDDSVTGRCAWLGNFQRLAQRQGNLGERMERALLRFPSNPVLLIGSDIPDIGARQIAAGFAALGHNDLVFGPADDGGYWLVGARYGGLARGLFKNVRWSGPHALADTLANAKQRRIALLEELADIDTADDLARWGGVPAC
ncbi:MAG: rSAM/selenodomain-associated transferase 1 [Alphaproteobacteria bacterium]|jgi:rSAM/selenodomain-associated transferase 1